MKKGELVKKLEIGIEEVILFLIIVLNVLDAFEVISSDWDYIKKIISWTAIGYLLYKAGPSKIFVGFRRKSMDALLIAGYFLMIIKNLISYAQVAYSDASSFLFPLYNYLITHTRTIEINGLYIGLFLIVVVCFNLSLRTPLLAPSMLHLMRADKKGHDIKTFLLHFGSLIIISLSFFLIFFNLIMEWLAIAIDAPLLMIGLATYFFFVLKHKEKFSATSFLSRFGDFGSKLYQGIIEHLRYKRTFLRVVSGVLVLHVLTDALTFLWQYTFGIADPLYLELIGPHPHVIDLLRQDLSISWLTSIIHVSNFVGMVFLLITPLLLWFALYFHKEVKVSNRLLVLLVFCVSVMLLNPAFEVFSLQGKTIYGVDILGVSATQFAILPFSWTITLALIITVLLASIYIKSLKTVLLVASKTFFIMYVALYFFSISSYYIGIIPRLLSSNPFMSLVFTLFFCITIMFYVVGLGSFLIDTHRHLDDHINAV